MEICIGTLVACNMRWSDPEGGVNSFPDEKGALGIVISENPRLTRPPVVERQIWQVKITDPADIKGEIIGFLEKDLRPLAQGCDDEPLAHHTKEHLPEILLTMIRVEEKLEKMIEKLEREIASLRQIVGKRADGIMV